MRDIPILMNGPMVRAVLEGRKTVTRRTVKPQPKVYRDFLGAGHVFGIEDKERPWVVRCLGSINFSTLYSPYQAGDRLWVRESCRVVEHEPYGRVRVRYEADGSYGVAEFPSRLKPVAVGKCIANGCHREAARITLEVTGVRVERLQDISDEQCIAEGIERDQAYPTLWRRGRLEGDQNTATVTGFPKLAFRSIWEAINGPSNWDANPWVWVVEFKRIAQMSACSSLTSSSHIPAEVNQPC